MSYFRSSQELSPPNWVSLHQIVRNTPSSMLPQVSCHGIQHYSEHDQGWTSSHVTRPHPYSTISCDETTPIINDFMCTCRRSLSHNQMLAPLLHISSFIMTSLSPKRDPIRTAGEMIMTCSTLCAAAYEILFDIMWDHLHLHSKWHFEPVIE